MYKEWNNRKLHPSLKNQRKSAGFTQKEVESALTLRPLQIHDYESGRLKLPIAEAVRIAKLYQCSLEELIGLERASDHKPLSENGINPLITIGALHDKDFQRAQKIFSDPVIRSATGLLEYKPQHSLLSLFFEHTNTQNRDEFILELLHYVNSLIGSDQRMAPEEISFRNALVNGLDFELSVKQKKSLSKALTIRYLSADTSKVFDSLAHQHFLIWTLLLCARSDSTLHHKEWDYVCFVGEGFKVPIRNIEFIRDQVFGPAKTKD